MANEMKYKDTTWPSDSPISGKPLAANGEYLGEQVGTPTQDAKATAAVNADSFDVAHNTVRQGTLTPDAGDSNFPEVDTGEEGGAS